MAENPKWTEVDFKGLGITWTTISANGMNLGEMVRELDERIEKYIDNFVNVDWFVFGDNPAAICKSEKFPFFYSVELDCVFIDLGFRHK